MCDDVLFFFTMKSAILVEQTQTSSQEILEIKTDKARQSSFVDTPIILEKDKKMLCSTNSEVCNSLRIRTEKTCTYSLFTEGYWINLVTMIRTEDQIARRNFNDFSLKINEQRKKAMNVEVGSNAFNLSNLNEV